MQDTGNSQPVTLSDQIRAALRLRLESGWLPPDARFPSESAVAQEFGVTRMTARKAILSLIEAGLLYRVLGKGTFAAGPAGARTMSPKARPNTILMIVPNLRLSFYNQIIQRALDVMESRGFDVVLRVTHDAPLQERRCLEMVDPARYEGVILLGVLSMQSNRDMIVELCGKLPVVIVDDPGQGLNAGRVYSDDVSGAYTATSHLVQLGHRRIAHIAAVDDRLLGYRQALEHYGIQYDEEIVRFTNWKLSEGYAEATKIMLNHRDVTAIFAANDMLAAGAYQALAALGVSVPGDVALVGYGDLDISELLGVKLTTVNQDPVRMGDEAANLLLAALSGECNLAQTGDVVIPTRLVVRDSCGIRNPHGQVIPD